MEPSTKISEAMPIKLKMQTKKINSLLMLIVPFFILTETQYAVVKHVAKKNKWNLIA
jgi:hypothetical protein